MKNKADIFLAKALGEDFLENLEKSAPISKLGGRSLVELDDIYYGIQLLPRTLMSFLIHNIKDMKVGDNKELQLPVQENAIMYVTKHDRDMYTGSLHGSDRKLISDFKQTSLPRLGLIIMSAFELYDIEDLQKPAATEPDLESKVQKMIDERMRMNHLVEHVVENKLSQREAVQRLIFHKINEMVDESKKKDNTPVEAPPQPTQPVEKIEEIPEKGPHQLKKFLNKVKKKNEHFIVMAKGESVNCDTCGNTIFSNNAYNGCLCFGYDMDSKVIVKNEDNGIKLIFGKSWDKENLEMLLDLMKKRNSNE